MVEDKGYKMFILVNWFLEKGIYWWNIVIWTALDESQQSLKWCEFYHQIFI
jgi:hypothetical protein